MTEEKETNIKKVKKQTLKNIIVGFLMVLACSIGFIVIGLTGRPNDLENFRQYYNLTKTEMKNIEVCEDVIEFLNIVESNDNYNFVIVNGKTPANASFIKESLNLAKGKKLYYFNPTICQNSTKDKTLLEEYLAAIESTGNENAMKVQETGYYKVLQIFKKTDGAYDEAESLSEYDSVNRGYYTIEKGVFKLEKAF